MKSSLSLVCALCAAMALTGCSESSRMVVAPAPAPVINPNVNAQYQMTGPVSAGSSVKVFTFLGMHFGNADYGKCGEASSPLKQDDECWSLGRFLFGSPVSRDEGVSAAYFNALSIDGIDALVQTKTKTEVSGFSLFGLIGYGSATTTLNGVGVKIEKIEHK